MLGVQLADISTIDALAYILPSIKLSTENLYCVYIIIELLQLRNNQNNFSC